MREGDGAYLLRVHCDVLFSDRGERAAVPNPAWGAGDDFERGHYAAD